MIIFHNINLWKVQGHNSRFSHCANIVGGPAGPYQTYHIMSILPVRNQIRPLYRCSILGPYHAGGTESLPGPIHRDSENGSTDYRQYVLTY